MDKPWLRLHLEWMATAYKYILRRDQIQAAQPVVHTNPEFKDDVIALANLQPEEFSARRRLHRA